MKYMNGPLTKEQEGLLQAEIKKGQEIIASVWRERDARAAPVADAVPAVALSPVADVAPVVAPQAAPLPRGFKIENGGLWYERAPKKEDDEGELLYIGRALYVTALARDKQNEGWGLRLEWSDNDGVLHHWTLQAAMLASSDVSGWLSVLMSGGWRGASSNKTKALLKQYLIECSPRAVLRSVSTTGWHECNGRKIFILNPKQILVGTVGKSEQSAIGAGFSQNCGGTSSDKKAEHIEFCSPSSDNSYITGGNLQGWHDTIGALSLNNSRLMLAICIALSGPLLHLCGAENGGVHFYGKSSSGKSTAGLVAASVWGRGSKVNGFIKSWRATSNGLEGVAANINDTCLILDELGQCSAKDAAAVVYMLSNGQGKTRANRRGDARAAKAWRCTVLSNGEISIAGKIKSEICGRVFAGQEVRLVSLPADAGAGFGLFEDLHGFDSGQVFADKLQSLAAEHFGHAGPAFVQELLNNPEVIPCLNDRLEHSAALCGPAADGQVKRVAGRFMLFSCAGELAANFGLVPWSAADVQAAIAATFHAWVEDRGGVGAAEDEQILAAFYEFIEAHGGARFQDLDSTCETIVRDRAGFRRKVPGATEYLILPEAFRSVIFRGLNARRAAFVLLENGLLQRGDGRNLARKVRLPGLGSNRAYMVRLPDEVADM